MPNYGGLSRKGQGGEGWKEEEGKQDKYTMEPG